MTTANDKEIERYELQLSKQQVRRNKVIFASGLVLIGIGIGLGASSFFLFRGQAQVALWASIAAAALAMSLAGVTLVVRAQRSSLGDSRFDDLLSRSTPRLLGGGKIEDLETHQRHHRRRR